MLQVQDLNAGYNDTMILKNINFTFQKGKFYGILGPNGSGKTTFLKVISGVLKPKTGTILLEGKPIHTIKQKELAKKMAVLPQINSSAFMSSVRETIAAGRYPYQTGLFSTWGKQDEAAIHQAMEQTGILKYEETPLNVLSGGEQQRVFIAQALAQQAQILLLDEVTNHLDITHQKQSLDIIWRKVKEEQLTVIAIFHDINLASLYCDELILMEQGQIKEKGLPNEVITHQLIGEVYETPIDTYAHPTVPKPQITMLPATHQVNYKIQKEHICITENEVVLKSVYPLKVLSSAVYNAGLGWYTTLINRTVASNYEEEQIEQEVEKYLGINHFTSSNSVVMLTAIASKQAVIEKYELEDLSIIVMVTAGVGNAIDVSKAFMRTEKWHPGTVNTWVVINGSLSEEAFVQAMMTATEAKVKALHDEQIKDKLTDTFATGTSTDSLLIASTEVGELLKYAGPLTKVGKLIGQGVYDATIKAITKFKGD